MSKPSTKPTAAQRVVDARAALLQHGSERLEIEGRAALAESERLASKSDQRRYKAACAKLSEIAEELDRVGLLVGEAEAELRAAEADEKRDAFVADVSTFEGMARHAVVSHSELARALGAYVAARAKFAQAFTAAGTRESQLQRKADREGLAFASDMAGKFEPFGQLTELLRVAPRITSLEGMTDHACLAAITDATRAALGHRAPKSGAHYGLAGQVADMIAGTYASRLEAIETAL